MYFCQKLIKIDPHPIKFKFKSLYNTKTMERIDRSLSTKVLQSLNANQIANLKAMNAKLKQRGQTTQNDANKENVHQVASRELREQPKLPRRQGHELYLPNILKHLRSTALKNITLTDPFDNQSEINRRMRGILFNWLLEIQFKFELKTRTIFLASNIFDRYLEVKQVSRDQLQLVGISCFWVASKYEDIYPPELKELVHLCDQLYSAEDIISCEADILSHLNFDFVFVSCLDAVEILYKLKGVEEKRVDEATKLVLHIFLFHSCLSRFGSFVISDFARYMGMKMLGLVGDKGHLSNEEIRGLEEEFMELVEAMRKDQLVALELRYKSLFFKLLHSVFN